MNNYVSVLIWLGVAEVLRRFILSLLCAFTGPLSKVPGPFINKLTGIPWIIENITGNMMNLVPEYHRKYGDVVRIAPREVLVNEKSGVQKILVDDDLVKAPIYGSLQPEGKSGKITSLITERDKAAYKLRRRHLSPGFSISYLNGLEPLMLECIQTFENYLNTEIAKGKGSAIVDMSRVLGNLTSDVMSATSFGGSLGLVASDDAKLKNMFMNRLKRSAIDSQFAFFKNLPFVPEPNAQMNKIIDDIVAKRRKLGEKKKDLVQIFVDTNDADPVGFSQKHLQEEMALFMIAGSDTTSTTATFTQLLLLNNPETLKALKAEIDAAFPSVDDPITFAKTQDLHYLNAVINESMRVLPIVVVGLARYTEQATVICNYEIPAGTVVAAVISSMQKDPRIWPDPESFIPERWLGKYKGVDADRKAFMPFSAGSRNCIGQQFALKELRLIMATLVRRYELSLVLGQSHEMRVHTVPWFKQGYYNVGVKLRD